MYYYDEESDTASDEEVNDLAPEVNDIELTDTEDDLSDLDLSDPESDVENGELRSKLDVNLEVRSKRRSRNVNSPHF